MSGGSLDYLYGKLEERASELETSLAQYREAMALMSGIARQMEWGMSGDDCYACAKLRVIAGLESFLLSNAESSEEALKILKNEKENLCPMCEARKKGQK